MLILFLTVALVHLIALMSPGPDFFFVSQTAASRSRREARHLAGYRGMGGYRTHGAASDFAKNGVVASDNYGWWWALSVLDGLAIAEIGTSQRAFGRRAGGNGATAAWSHLLTRFSD